MTMGGPDRSYDDGPELQERVVQIRRVAKVVKGGRHITFYAMVVVGDGKGKVGAGLGKGAAVPDAVRKGTTIARRNMVSIPLKDATVPYAVRAHFGASRVLIKPAPPGAGIKAGAAVRAVMEAVGVRDIVAKALGSRNPINVVKATLVGLQSLRGGEVDEGQVRRTAKLPPAPERRGPVRREGGGPRDRDRRRPDRPPGSGGPPRPAAAGPPRPADRPPRPAADGPPRPAADGPARPAAPAPDPAPPAPAPEPPVLDSAPSEPSDG